MLCPGLADAGEIAFDVGGEDRHADAAERLGHDLQGHGLAGTGGAGDQAVAIGEPGQQQEFVFGVVSFAISIGWAILVLPWRSFLSF